MRNMLLALAALVVTAGLIAAGAMAQTGAIEITDAWARATPGKAENGAAYLTMAAPDGDRLTGISTPVARMAELHTMRMEGGIMRMSPLGAIDLPAGQPVTLKPGATHIMLVGLKEPLRAGQSIPLTLHFAKGGTREVIAAVGKIGATAPDGHAHRGMHMPAPANR